MLDFLTANEIHEKHGICWGDLRRLLNSDLVIVEVRQCQGIQYPVFALHPEATEEQLAEYITG